MSKMEKVEDTLNQAHPLRVWRRIGRRKMGPSIRVKCGCCEESLVIHFDDNPTGIPNYDTLEINGVLGTVDQWRQVLLPLLGLKDILKA